MFRNPLTDVLVVLVIVLLILGPKQLPALGRGLREFKDSLTSGDSDSEDADRPELTTAAAPPAAASQAKSAESAKVDSERQG